MKLLPILMSASEACDKIPDQITGITSLLYQLILVGVPIILVVMGMMDFGRAVMAGKEDEIKASQKLFIRRLISAALVFLILFLVKFVVELVATDPGSVTACMDKILSGV